MSKEPNNIDRLVREKLDGFEMAPPASVWNNTSAALKSRRKRRIILWSFFGLLMLTGAGTGVYLTINEQANDADRSQHATTTTKKHPTSRIKTLVPIDLDSLNNRSNTTSDITKKTNGTTTSSALSDTPTSYTNAAKNKTLLTSAKQHELTPDNSRKKSVFNVNGFNSSETSGKRSHKNNLTNENEQLSSREKSQDFTQNEPLTTPMSLFHQPSALPFKSTELFVTKSPEIATNRFEEDALPAAPPFWKAFSFEGSFGISLLKNQPNKNATDSVFYNLINSAATARRSYDFHFGANYHFTPRVSFQTGLDYSSEREDYSYKKEQITIVTYLDSTILSIDTVTMDTTYNYFDVISEQTEIIDKKEPNNYKMVSIPFHFAYSKPIGIRGELEIAFGGSLTIFGKNTGTLIVDPSNYTVAAQNGYHTKGMLSLGGSLKYIYRFGLHHAAYVEPWVRFGITNQSTPTLSYESVRNKYGIRFGYRFYL